MNNNNNHNKLLNDYENDEGEPSDDSDLPSITEATLSHFYKESMAI